MTSSSALAGLWSSRPVDVLMGTKPWGVVGASTLMGATAASLPVGRGVVGDVQVVVGETVLILGVGEVRGEGGVATEGTGTD